MKLLDPELVGGSGYTFYGVGFDAFLQGHLHECSAICPCSLPGTVIKLTVPTEDQS